MEYEQAKEFLQPYVAQGSSLVTSMLKFEKMLNSYFILLYKHSHLY
jgi:hypothetical protein